MSALDNAVKLADITNSFGDPVGIRIPTGCWFGGITEDAVSLWVEQGVSNGNRVQIEGRASGQPATIRAFDYSGSTADAGLRLSSGGTASVEILTNGLGRQVARFMDTVDAVNFWDVYGAAANGNVRLVANGSDTDIDVQLSPKGTGTLVIPIANIRDFANDAAAAAASPAVPVGGLYRNGSVLMIRVS